MRGMGRRRRGGGPRRISRFVEPALLLLLHRGPNHGYGLMDSLGELGFGEYPMDYSAVYRALRTLEDSGMVASLWDLESSAGPPRRVYTITPDGGDYLGAWVHDLRATDRVLHAFLGAYDREIGDRSEPS